MNWNDSGIVGVTFCIVFVDFVVRNHGGCAFSEFAL